MTGDIKGREEGFKKKREIKDAVASLWEKFPDIAKNLIQNSQDLSEEKNRNFFENPDDPLAHEPNWHQWGIITHTKMFEKFYLEEIPKYLTKWGVLEKARNQMSKEIDGISREQLLNVAI